jgi:hypothetical protein
MTSFVGTPCFLCSDVNIKPEESLPVRTALDAGVVTDLAADWHDSEKRWPWPTDRKEGVHQGMEGKGVSRLDVALCNASARGLVRGVEYLWAQSAAFDHVAIAVTLKCSAAVQEVLRASKPVGIDVDQHCYAIPANAKAKERVQI